MDSQAAGQVALFQSALCDEYDLLSRCLVVSPRLLMKLKPSEYLRDRVKQIRQQTAADQKVTELLTILDETPDDEQQSAYDWFLTALRQDGQEHVANIFRPESDARPMSDEHYQLLLSKQQQVCQYLDTANGLVDELFEREVFTDRDCRSVNNKTEHDEMSRELVSILLRKPDSAFDEFIGALVATKQEHVASLLGHECHEQPMTEEHRQLLAGKKEELCLFIDPSCTLFSRLEAVGVFNKRDIDSVASKLSYTNMSIELVNVLLLKPDSSFDKFIEALNDTEQQHVVYILTGQGESPLSRVRRSVLRKARDRLVSRVDTMHTLFLAKLISSGVLTDDDKERIEVHKVNELRTAELVDIIARKSHSAYDKFLQALKDSGHMQVAEELHGLELKGLVNPHFLHDTPSADRNRIVKIVRNNMKALVSGEGFDIEEITNVMELNGFAVSDVSEGSIHISFMCFTVESVLNLKRLYTDKTLDRLFTKVFCPEFAADGLESLNLHITDEEFENLTQTFNRMDAEKISSDKRRMLFEQSLKVQQVNELPLELLELVLMRTFIRLFTDSFRSKHMTHKAIQQVYGKLARVCYNWWQTMNGWPQSTTKHWFRHKLHQAIKDVCRPYRVFPRLQFSLSLTGRASGVTQCDNKLFVLSSLTNSIRVFGPNNKQISNIELEQMNIPSDIVSCTETQQLYVAGESRDSTYCVWRVSLDGRQVVKWLPNKPTTTSQFRPHTLSVTSGRLLVTSYNNELLLYGADGVELKLIPLPDIASLLHAVETSRGTFIVSHFKPQPRVCEVNADGHVTCVYNGQPQLFNPVYLSLDSDGRIFVADHKKDRVLLLNSETLELERVLLDRQQHQLTVPYRLCYAEQTGQLAILSKGTSDCVHLFAVC